VLLMYVYYGSIYAALQDVVPSRLRGSAVALYFFAMYVLGASLGPFVTGALSDRLARHAGAAQGLHDAFYVVPCLGLLLAATLFLAARTSRRA
jgi:MFS family permease